VFSVRCRHGPRRQAHNQGVGETLTDSAASSPVVFVARSHRPWFTHAMILFFMVGLEFTATKVIRYLVLLSLATSSGASVGFIVGIHNSGLTRTQEILTPAHAHDALLGLHAALLPTPCLSPPTSTSSPAWCSTTSKACSSRTATPTAGA
jgi:hypothetical protein